MVAREMKAMKTTSVFIDMPSNNNHCQLRHRLILIVKDTDFRLIARATTMCCLY